MKTLLVWSDAWECPPCSLPRLYFCSRLCLPTMRFPPLPCFLWSCRPPPAPPSRASLPLAQPLSGLEGSPPLVNFSSASGASKAQCFAREPEYKSGAPRNSRSSPPPALERRLNLVWRGLARENTAGKSGGSSQPAAWLQCAVAARLGDSRRQRCHSRPVLHCALAFALALALCTCTCKGSQTHTNAHALAHARPQ